MKDNIKNVFVRKVKIVNKSKSISAGASVVQWKAWYILSMFKQKSLLLCHLSLKSFGAI